MKKTTYSLALSLLLLLQTVEAQTSNSALPASGELADKLADGTIELNDVPRVIMYWINWIPLIAGSIAVVMLVYGGFMFIVSGITEDKENAKNTVKWAILGVVVSSLAWVIVNFLQTAITR